MKNTTLWVILALLLILTVHVEARTIRHIRPELAQTNDTSITTLYQFLTDDIATALATSIGDNFTEAIRQIKTYRSFVVDLTEFRADLLERGIDALILSANYSTQPLTDLGRTSQDTVDAQQILVETIILAEEALQREDRGRVWIEVVRSQGQLLAFENNIDELNRTIYTLPVYIDPDQLEEQIIGLRRKLGEYAERISSLVGEGQAQLILTLTTDRTTVYLGDDFEASGTLFAGPYPVPGAEIRILNTTTAIATNNTDTEGRYTATIHIPLKTQPQNLTIKAIAVLEGADIQSPQITLRIERIPTTITLRARETAIRTGEPVELTGYLLGHDERGLDGITITILQEAGERWITTTTTGGSYKITTPPILSQTNLTYISIFNGSRYYQPSISQKVEIRVGLEEETNLTLQANTTLARPGDTIQFWGRLQINNQSSQVTSSDKTITLSFLGTETDAQTNQGGNYTLEYTIPIDTLPGTYPAQSHFYADHDTYLTDASSEIVLVTIRENMSQGTQTILDLDAQPKLLEAGETTTFTGTLSTIGGQPLLRQNIRIRFLGTTQTTQTREDGTFQIPWQTDPQTAKGTYQAIAIFDPEPETNLSYSASNTVHITILGGEKKNTHLQIWSPNTTAKPGQNIQVKGRLTDNWGKGLPDQEIILTTNQSKQDIQTDEEGQFIEILDLPDQEGILYILAVFQGDLEYLPTSSNILKIQITYETQRPNQTFLSLEAPGEAETGSQITLTGNLEDQTGKGLASKSINMYWDDQIKWHTTTDSTGNYRIIITIPNDEGNHTIHATFNTNDPDLISSRSQDHTIRVNIPIITSYLMYLILSIIPIILVGLALARGLRPRIRLIPIQKTPPEEEEEEMKTLAIEEESEESVPAPKELPESRDLAKITDPRTRMLSAYHGLVKMIGQKLSTDLSTQTHTQILTILVTRVGEQSETRQIATDTTQIYEKTAFSKTRPTKKEQSQFYDKLVRLAKSLEETTRKAGNPGETRMT